MLVWPVSRLSSLKTWQAEQPQSLQLQRALRCLPEPEAAQTLQMTDSKPHQQSV